LDEAPITPSKRRRTRKHRGGGRRNRTRRNAGLPLLLTTLKYPGFATPQFAVVVHAVPTNYRIGETWRWVEENNSNLHISRARSLLSEERRLGKAESSMVLYLEGPTTKGALRLRRKPHRLSTYMGPLRPKTDCGWSTTGAKERRGREISFVDRGTGPSGAGSNDMGTFTGARGLPGPCHFVPRVGRQINFTAPLNPVRAPAGSTYGPCEP